MMNRKYVVLFVTLGAFIVVIAVALLSGAVPISQNKDSQRAPCDQLPDQVAVAEAIDQHQTLVAELETIGSGVSVNIAHPCDDMPHRAIIRISYSTDEVWKQVDSIMRDSSFGVAGEVIGA